ncbi:TetR family transcriptional regulator [Amycolatopsis coloradensis]|uniref:TetR family transcriptional regulator n=1 Tax=Amycolatopsis coloradensis TaxID=76021 RepID=A0A1R0L0K4_9PSEU|nr:TetR/AcrR family transcriptional regulator [Amycolatopsis coloradensis]OLZ55422.1 TetR family transcriptional regulator [Amycolatopsis coloradensis]
MTAKRLTREESREQTRQRLLTAAAELFAQRGVNGTSVEQIAERAGFTRGAFYGNFDGKHELVVELLRRRTQREAEEVTALRDGVGSFSEMMDRLRAWNVERAEHLGGWLTLRTELALYALRNPEARPLVGEGEKSTRALLETSVKTELAARGVVPPADPAFLALILHALEDGLLLQRFLSPEGTGDEDVVDAVQLLMRSWTALSRSS